MSVATANPANVVQVLVFTLLDVLDATRDLYQTLKAKEKRDHEQSLRSRGYPSDRRIDYVDDEEASDNESLIMDKAAVKRRFEIGLREVGTPFAIGDVISQTALQSQIITLQSVIISTFLYGPTSLDSISHQLTAVVIASRSAGTTAVDVLAAQQERQTATLVPTARSRRGSVAHAGSIKALPYPVTTDTGPGSSSTTLVRARSQRETRDDDKHSRMSPANTTVFNRPKATRTDTESTALSGPTSYGTQSAPHDQYCLYALDLQRHRSQPLSTSITSDPSPYCPYCKRTLRLSPGRSWEVFKDDNEGTERCFRIQNRFVVKCHRDSPDGGFCCVLCSNNSSDETVCGNEQALIRHVWQDHGVGDLKSEEDIIEIIEKVADRRRDSGFGSGSRRSVSLGPSKGRGRRRFEREVETVEIRHPRRES